MQDGQFHIDDPPKKKKIPKPEEVFGVQKTLPPPDEILGEKKNGITPSTNGSEVGGPFSLQSMSGIEKAQQGIEEFNKQFQTITGHEKFTLTKPIKPANKFSLSNIGYEERKKQFEQDKFVENKAAEEEINQATSSVHFGSSTVSDDLKNLAQKPYGKNIVRNIISEYAPEAQQPDDILNSDFDLVADKIKSKNRINGVNFMEGLDQSAVTNIQNAVNSFEVGWEQEEFVGGAVGTGSVIVSKPTRSKLPAIDFTDDRSVTSAMKFIQDKEYLIDASGKKTDYALQNLYSDLDRIHKKLIEQKGMDPEIEALNTKISSVVTDNIMRSDKDVPAVINEGDVAVDISDKVNNQTNHLKTGINYIKDIHKGWYDNVIRGLTEKSDISESDYKQLSSIGQDIDNEKVFKKAATDPSFFNKETNYDYTTKEEMKAEIAGSIGELAKAKGYKGLEFSPQLIKQLGRELGYADIKREIVEELAMEEGIGNYDAIPKTGQFHAGLKGVQMSIAGIGNTISEVFYQSPAETYLRSKRLDVGTGQKVPDEKGEMSAELPSDRGNVWYDMLEGATQMLTQVFLTKGIGSGLTGAARLGLSSVPRAALTATQAANITAYGGTFVSQYLQTYGDAYAQALQKTGDPGLARLMGGIDATTTAFSELILPDIKIAQRAFSGLKGAFVDDIAGVFKKGGGLSALRENARPFIQKFATGLVDITGKETTEEVSSNTLNYLNEAIFSPGTVKNRDLVAETWQTIKATAVATVLPAVFGAGGGSFNRDFSVTGLHSAAINIGTYKDDLKRSLASGSINQEEYNNSVRLLQTHRNSLFSVPATDANGNNLSKQQTLGYAFHDTNLKILNDELKKTDGKVAKEVIENKIKESEDAQRAILMPEVKEETGVNVVDSKTPQPAAQLTETKELTPDEGAVTMENRFEELANRELPKGLQKHKPMGTIDIVTGNPFADKNGKPLNWVAGKKLMEVRYNALKDFVNCK